jgi:hypothetical protein
MLSPLPSRRPEAMLRAGMLGMLCLIAALSGFAAAAEDESAPRFSATLSTAQRAEAGLTQLTEDNIAVIDALVRQDEALLRRHSKALGAGNFSQRRTAHERDIAGLAKLTPGQQARLDELIARRSAAAIPMLTAELGAPPAIRRIPERDTRAPALEVHGSVSLTYGWSKEGDVRGGSMVVSLQDPAHRFTVLIGYSEFRGKGNAPYFDPADDFYRYRPVSNSPSLATEH